MKQEVVEGMLERGSGIVEVIDRERGLALEMIAADGQGYQEYRMTGPELSVRFATERDLRHEPPIWRIRVVGRDQVSLADDELLPLIQSVVSFTAGSLLKTDSSNFIVSF